MIAAAFLTIALLANGAAAQAGADGVWKARYTTTEKRTHEFVLTLKTSDGAISGNVVLEWDDVTVTGRITGARE